MPLTDSQINNDLSSTSSTNIKESELGVDGNSKIEPTLDQYLSYFMNYDIIVDSVFGFSFSGPPRDPFKLLITAISKTEIPVISVDVPSG